MTKSLELGILFSTLVREVVLIKLVIPGISLLTPLMLALREALVAKLLISGILFAIFFILLLVYFNLIYLNHQQQALIYQNLVYLLYF